MSSSRVERFFPRCYVNLRALLPGQDEEFQETFIPRRVSITRQAHTHAGECEIELPGAVWPLVGKRMEAATVAVYMGNAQSVEDRSMLPINTTIPSNSAVLAGSLMGSALANRDAVGSAAVGALGGAMATERSPFLRFIGDVDEPHASMSAKGPSLTLKCRDFSVYLHNAKPIPVKLAPRYGEPLKVIIDRILDGITGARGRLKLRDTPALRVATTNQSLPPGRRAPNGYVALKSQSSAWEAIAQAADIAACLVTVELDEIVVRSAGEIYAHVNDVTGGFGEGVVAASDPVGALATGIASGAAAAATQPLLFMFGSEDGNVSSVTLKRDFIKQRKGIRLVGSDPSGRKTLESLYPPDDQLAPTRLPKAFTSRKTRKETPAKEPVHSGLARDTFFVDFIHEKPGLDALAKRIYDTRRAYETTGSVESPFFTNDMLNIFNGTRFGLVANAWLEEKLDGLDESARARVIARELAITEKQAASLARLLRNGSTSERYYADKVHINWSVSGPSISVDFLNLIPSMPSSSK